MARPTASKFEGFDFLRAIFSLAIVALKTNLFLLADIFVSGTFAYFLQAEFAYLAVPVFVQISLFLLYLKTEDQGLNYFFQKRLPKLVYLYLFWVGLKIMFDVLTGQFNLGDSTSSPRTFIEFIVSGATSPFFFFFLLIFLSTLAAIFSAATTSMQDSRKLLIKYILLIASCGFVLFISMAEIVVTHFTGQPAPGVVSSISSIAFWDYNPLSFLPYLFTAAIAAQEVQQGKLHQLSTSLKPKFYSLLSLAILFSILEWHFFEKLLQYSRLSLIFTSWLVLYWALLSQRKVPAYIRFLSVYSLGIYGFHVFFNHYFHLSGFPMIGLSFQTMPGLEVLINFAFTLCGSILLTLLFKRIRSLKSLV